MKQIVIVLLLVACAQLSTKYSQAQDINKVIISLELKNATLKEAFAAIEKLTTFKFSYKTTDISSIQHIHYQQKNVSVKKVLDDLLSTSSLQYEVIRNNILVKKNNRQSARAVTVYGFVTAAQSGEALIGATISLSGDQAFTTTTNAYGFYSLTIPTGEYVLNCSYVGFQELDEVLAIEQGYRNNIGLSAKVADTLQSVMITSAGKKSIVRNVVTGNHRLSITDIKKMAMGGGEPDVLKSLQFLPGIQASAEGTTNLSVRGGSYDQNLILLDEAPVYNPTHTMGFFSAFNTDALKDVAIYKGVFPAQYGGRLSSVVDIRMKEGNNKEYEGSGGIGILASRLTFEGPIQKNRSSFMLSGRISQVGSFLNLAHALNFIDAGTDKNKIAFYDLNAKFNTALGKKDKLYLSAYTGRDKFYFAPLDNATRMNWGNTTVTARWNHVFNAHLFANTSVLYSNYNYTYYMLDDAKNFSWKANLKEGTVKTDIDWSTNKNSQFKFGAGITFQDVSPGQAIPNAAYPHAKATSLENRRSAQLFAYIHHEQKISSRISVAYGIRATGFAALGDRVVYRYNADTSAVIDSTSYGRGKIVQSYFAAEPKATARILLNQATSLKIAYGRNYQFQHLLSNSSVGLPTDMWMPSDPYFKPQYSDHYSAGVYKTFRGNMYEASLEGYYRQSHHIIDFKDNAELFLNDKIETQVLPGEARGYGIELLVKKNKGPWTGWVSYTWSKASRRIAGINDNEWYPATYDRRHNFSVVYNWTITDRLSVSGIWVYRSGGHITFPLGTYAFYGNRYMYYSSRNGYTLPAYHRLDLSMTWKEKIKKKRKWQGEWVLSIYNAYSRHNVFALYVKQDIRSYNFSTTKVYLGGILPTVTYNFNF